jgi:phosphohistidine phosphatase
MFQIGRASTLIDPGDQGSIPLTINIPFHKVKGGVSDSRDEGGDVMKLYLIQHGEAKTEREDPERSLTERGEDEVKRVAEAGKRLGVLPSKIYHSGKLRAKQTADMIAGALKIPGASVQAVQGLNPNDDVRPWAERISTESEDLMLVGHLPFLDKLASLLLCGDENARLVLFRYSAIVRLDQKEDRRWAVRWILTPEMISYRSES